MDDTILDALWVFDSETSIEWLIDLKTGTKIMKREDLNESTNK